MPQLIIIVLLSACILAMLISKYFFKYLNRHFNNIKSEGLTVIEVSPLPLNLVFDELSKKLKNKDSYQVVIKFIEGVGFYVYVDGKVSIIFKSAKSIDLIFKK